MRREDPIENSSEYLDRLGGEKGFQGTVVELAKRTGWVPWHDQDSRKNEPGMPDLILIRPPRVLFAECKTKGGKLSADQSFYAAILRECPGVEYYIWRPADWDQLEKVLAPSTASDDPIDLFGDLWEREEKDG